jgi:hypothetical protein
MDRNSLSCLEIQAKERAWARVLVLVELKMASLLGYVGTISFGLRTCDFSRRICFPTQKQSGAGCMFPSAICKDNSACPAGRPLGHSKDYDQEMMVPLTTQVPIL